MRLLLPSDFHTQDQQQKEGEEQTGVKEEEEPRFNSI